MPNIRVNDLSIYYEITGEGSPLVLLPGLLGTIESNWRRFIPALESRYRVVAIDLRGHGRTDNPAPGGKQGPGELDIDRMTDDFTGLLDALDLDRVSVLGYSLGGAIGLLAGLRRPGRIGALAMHATKFFWDEASLSAMAADLDPAALLEKSPRYALSLEESHAAIYGRGYWRVLLGAAARFVRTMPERGPTLEQAARADFPVLVSAGDHDQLVRPEEAIRLARTLPRGELLVLPATRHPLQSVRPHAFLPLLRDFLERAAGT